MTASRRIASWLLCGITASKRLGRLSLPPEPRLVFSVLASLMVGWPSAAQAGAAANGVTVIQAAAGGQVIKAQLGADGAIHLLIDKVGGPYYMRSTNEGLTFTAPIPIVDVASQKPGLEFHAADLAIGQGGRVHVAMANNAWKLKLPQEEWSLYYSSLAPGEKLFSPVRNLNRKPSEGFSLSADERGRVTAAFLSDKLYVMNSRDNGETFADAAELKPGWDPCNCCTTSIAYGLDGRLALLYREEANNERDMFVALWDQNRAVQPLRTRVSTTSWKIEGCPMTYFAVGRAPSGYVAAWPTRGQVYFARLDKDGAMLPPGEIKTPGTTGMRMDVLALAASDGAILIAWKNKDVLGWQLYDATGQPAGEPGSAASPGHGAAGVAIPNGKFILFP
jgi:hypothetical protein